MSQEPKSEDKSRRTGCGAEDALALLQDLASDTKSMASALVNELSQNMGTVRTSSPRSELTRALQLAQELDDIFAWSDERPMAVANDLKAIDSDIWCDNHPSTPSSQ